MRVPTKSLTIVTCLLVAGWMAAHAAQRPAERAIPTEGRSFTFRADTPPVDFRPQDAEDPFVDIRIEGFRARSSTTGAPDVPTRTVLVAIPPGATPRLSVRRIGERRQLAHRPRPVPRVLHGVASFDRSDRQTRPAGPPITRKLFRAADRFYSGDAVSPQKIAWLGHIGVLRDQR